MSARTNNGVEKAKRSPKGPAFRDEDLSRLKVIRGFRVVLAKVITRTDVKVASSFSDPKRQLTLGDYLSLFLLALFNPVARTMRGLVQASGMRRVQRGICSRAVSLGSFSEAQHLVEPALLETVLAHLFGQLPALEPRTPALGTQSWKARDSSLFAALPRMTWAFYGGGREGCLNNAVRLHVSFDLLKDAPEQVRVTPGKTCERAALRADLQRGDGYVGDRYFGGHYAFFTYLSRQGCRYLIRLLDRGVAPQVEEELPVTTEDAAHCVERQAWVRLGNEARGTLSERLRLIWVRGVNDQELLLVTNLPPETLSAADAALLYKERWQVEYFFRWIKCLLGDNQWHWMAESPKGVAIQLYLTLIAAVLLQLDFGRRPSKRVWELLRWYLSGMIEEEELETLLARQLAHEAQIHARRVAKKSSAAR